MPVLPDLEARNRDRAVQHPQAAEVGQGLADVAGQRGDQVGGGEDGRQAQEAGKAQRQAALEAQAADGGVEQLGPRAIDDAGVRLAAVVVQAEGRAGADAGVVGMRQADPVLVIEGLLVEAGVQRGDEAQRQIRGARFQLRAHAGVDGRGFQRHAGRQGAHLREEARQQGDVAGIGHEDAEPPRHGRGVEDRLLRFGGDGAQPLQHAAHGGDHGFHARRGQHALRGAHEERIAQLRAQPR